MTLTRTLVSLLFLLLPLSAFAAVPTWQIVPSASAIRFSATQNGAPVTGQFKSFSGEIHFDPEQLAASNISIDVDINSVTTADSEVSDTLKTPDWFDVKVFPHAVFKASSFKKTGANTYQADGTLTIRDKTSPVTLVFAMDKYTSTDALAKGTATLKRTVFGVGKGDWAKTDEIKDDVKVDFVLAAKK
jgi:polyisoprenoid-binding protein YceI